MNGLTVEAKVCKISDSGKSMLVGIKPNKYVIGMVFGWVANPDKLAKDAIIKDFPMPTGTTPCYNVEEDMSTLECAALVVSLWAQCVPLAICILCIIVILGIIIAYSK